MKIRISGIINESIVDGPGIRMAVFAQGCERACPGCHNPQTHALDGGYETTLSEIMQAAGRNPLLRGLTFSGGEPFLQAPAFAVLAKLAHAAGLDIVTFTGYTIEEILGHGENSDDGFRALLAQTDILIDGPYIEAQRTYDASFRGSANQRVIDVAATLAGVRAAAARTADADAPAGDQDAAAERTATGATVSDQDAAAARAATDAPAIDQDAAAARAAADTPASDL